jgi:hypothetical protein
MPLRAHAILSLVLVAGISLALSARATNGIECGCAAIGPYTDPVEGVPPSVTVVSVDSGTSPHGLYNVAALDLGSVIDLTVTRASSGAIRFHDSPPAGSIWGFSPDDDRFVLQ